MYQYKINQPKRIEIDGPFKGTTWVPGKMYEAVPEDKIGAWFETNSIINDTAEAEIETLPDEKEIDQVVKKNSGGTSPGPELLDPDEIDI